MNTLPDGTYELIASSDEICCSSGSGSTCLGAALHVEKTNHRSSIVGKHTDVKCDLDHKQEDRFDRFVGEVGLPESKSYKFVCSNNVIHNLTLSR